MQTAKKHMKRCSVSPTNRDMSIAGPMRYHYTPFRITKIKNRGTSNVGDDEKKPDHSCMAGGDVNGASFWRTVCSLS